MFLEASTMRSANSVKIKSNLAFRLRSLVDTLRRFPMTSFKGGIPAINSSLPLRFFSFALVVHLVWERIACFVFSFSNTLLVLFNAFYRLQSDVLTRILRSVITRTYKSVLLTEGSIVMPFNPCLPGGGLGR